MDTNDIIGYVGTGVLAVTLVPQVYKTFRSKQANDLSWSYLFLQIVANVLFIIYGFGIGSLPVIISNCMVSVLSLSLVFAKYKFPIGGEYTPILSVSV
jgi:MtN3 and saliva related transmembrane protein